MKKKAKTKTLKEEETYSPVDINSLDKEYQKTIHFIQQQFTQKFSNLIIWGWKEEFHTHRYIHKAFYRTAKKLALPVIWLDDKPSNTKYLSPKSLIIDFFGQTKHLPILPDVYYCHHISLKYALEKKWNNINLGEDKVLYLVVFRESEKYYCEANNFISWDFETFFSEKEKILVQSWGTDLLPWEFLPPVFNKTTNQFYWVGSIWEGNIRVMQQLKKHLKRRNMKFFHFQRTTEQQNIDLIRKSRLAPSIGGDKQVKLGYIPCRFYKNISYGQLAFTNINFLNNTFQDCNVQGNSLEELIDNALELKEQEYLDMIYKLQAIVKRQTYLQKIFHIMKAFSMQS